MSLESLAALIGFAFVMSISPGPGNFLLLTSGANFGFARSIPLVLGISFGFLSMVFAIGLGLGAVLESYPLIGKLLRLACAAYVLWLAWRISQSRSLGKAGAEQLETPFSFIQAASLQLLNPKAWSVALIVTVAYLAPEAGVGQLLALIAIFAAVNIPSISIWALSGHGLRRVLAKERRIATFNVAMAILLVVSMIPALLSLSQ